MVSGRDQPLVDQTALTQPISRLKGPATPRLHRQWGPGVGLSIRSRLLVQAEQGPTTSRATLWAGACCKAPFRERRRPVFEPDS
jgi:hypothetical protein